MLNQIAKTALVLTLACSLVPASFAAESVAAKVEKLVGSFRYGDHARVVRTQTTDPQKMIYRFLCVVHSPAEAKQFKLVKGAHRLVTDARVAGTLMSHAAATAIANQFISNEQDHGVDLDPDTAKYCAKIVRELAAAGCSLGFDGSWQNEGPTPYFLVIDPAGKAVYGFDIGPGM
jgi:hypothetical protein